MCMYTYYVQCNLHMYVHTYIHTAVHTCVRTYVHTALQPSGLGIYIRQIPSAHVIISDIYHFRYSIKSAQT